MNPIAAMLLGCCFAMTTQAEQPQTAYSFISGDDLFDALSQDSMVLQGYMLGVTDALKHSSEPAECFTIPLRPDADQVIYASYLRYWKARSPRPNDATQAISEMMVHAFPCSFNN